MKISARLIPEDAGIVLQAIGEIVASVQGEVVIVNSDEFLNNSPKTLSIDEIGSWSETEGPENKYTGYDVIDIRLKENPDGFINVTAEMNFSEVFKDFVQQDK